MAEVNSDNPSQPWQKGAKRPVAMEQRLPYSAAIAIAGMSLLGIAAMMAQWLKEGWISSWWIPHDPVLTLLLCGVIGAIIGSISVPFVTPCLKRNSWAKTAAKIYGANCILVVIYVLVKPTGLTGPLSAAFVAFIGVVGMSRMIRDK